MSIIPQFRSLQRDNLSDISSRFLIQLNRIAMDPILITAFSEGYVVGSTLNIDGEDWAITEVACNSLVGMSDRLNFWVTGSKLAAAKAEEDEKELKTALAEYESKVKEAALSLSVFCVQRKIQPEIITKLLKGA